MIPLFALTALGLAAQSPSARADPPAQNAQEDTSPGSLANLATSLSDADYPAEAIRRGEDGTVGFSLDVGPDGRVTGCEVTSSSGSKILDTTTCTLMRARARFRPALDRNGNPTADRISARVRWVLPTEPVTQSPGRVDLNAYVSRTDYPAGAIRRREQGQVVMVLTVSVEGRIVGCRVTQSSGSDLLDRRSCEIIVARARLQPPHDQTGMAMPAIVEGSLDWTLPRP